MATRAMYVAIVGIWVVALLVGRLATLVALASPNAATSAEITGPPFSSDPAVFQAPPMEDDSQSPELDILGNEVEHAIADYRIDRGGAVYERHSPETAVERLGSPST